MVKKVTKYQIAFVDRDQALINTIVAELIRQGVSVKFIGETEASPRVEVIPPTRGIPDPQRPSPTRRRRSGERFDSRRGATGRDRIMNFLRDNKGSCKTADVYEHIAALGYARSSVASFLSTLRKVGKIEYDAYNVVSSD